jgi:tetratricopeptide (TPR) repeat protein
LFLLVALTLIAVWRKSPVGILGAWFWMILAPSSSVVPVGTETMAEHRMYLPLIAVIVLTVLALFRLVRQRWLLPFLAVLAVGLGGMTALRNNDYRTEFGIWSDTATKRPDNARAHNNLGSLWLARGNLAEAERCFTTALQLQPLYASAHYNLGIVLQRTGRVADAIGHFLAALRLEEDFADAQVNVGNAFLQLARPAEAVAHYEVALRLQPESPDLHFNIGLALEQLNRSDEAIRQYQEALRLQPDLAAAQKALQAATTPRPPAGEPPGPVSSPPLLDLAANEAEHGDTAAAERHYREAIRLQSGQAAAHFGLGNLLAQSNRFSEAIEEYQRALAIAPGDLQVRNNLGNALLMAERVDEAIAQYEQILRLRPDDPGVTENLRQARALKEPSRRAP